MPQKIQRRPDNSSSNYPQILAKTPKTASQQPKNVNSFADRLFRYATFFSLSLYCHRYSASWGKPPAAYLVGDVPLIS
jgi:hypothetical protein